jgi:RNase P/RNase MRP subunit p30
MTRLFCDLHLKINSADAAATQRFLSKAAQLGYRAVGVTFNSTPSTAQIAGLKTQAAQAGIDVVTRTDFRPRNQEDLTRFLRKTRRQVEVIAIQCDTKEVARQAAKDRRVDLLSFPNFDYRKRFFDRAEAELASSCLTAFEVDVKPLLTLEGPPRVRLLSSLRREVGVALDFGVPLVVSSGVAEELLMRFPRDMASLAYLFGLGEEDALDAVSVNPWAIVMRNRAKLSEGFVAPGISVVREGGVQ